jgi:hypothetical protein
MSFDIIPVLPMSQHGHGDGLVLYLVKLAHGNAKDTDNFRHL